MCKLILIQYIMTRLTLKFVILKRDILGITDENSNDFSIFIA